MLTPGQMKATEQRVDPRQDLACGQLTDRLTTQSAGTTAQPDSADRGSATLAGSCSYSYVVRSVRLSYARLAEIPRLAIENNIALGITIALRACLIKAEPTLAVSLFGTLARITQRDRRSTSVTTRLPRAPDMRSPS